MQTDKSEELLNMVLLGADAETLYPSLKKEISAKIVVNELINADTRCLDLERKEMGKYVYLNMSPEEHKELGIGYWMPNRETNGRKSKLTMNNEQILGPKPPKEEKWIFVFM